MIRRAIARFSIALILLQTSAWTCAAPAATATASAGDPPGSGRLGKFGDFRTLPIEGASTIPADVLRSTLAKDWALQVVLAPSAPIEEFNAVIADRARNAYLASGFSSPKVQIRLDGAGNPQALIVDEGGPRRRQGRIRIEGARAIPVDEVIARLTCAAHAENNTRTPFVVDLNPAAATVRVDGFDPDAPPTCKVWEPGKWASFHPSWMQRQQRGIASAFARVGFFQTKFAMEVVVPPAGDANSAAGDAELVIKITDEGPRARLSGIDIVGLRRNPRDAVIATMALKETQPIDLRALLVAQQALWDAGRFKKHAMRLEQDMKGAAAGNMRLKLDVREHETLPLLDQPLSPQQQAILKFGAWMEGFGRREDELIATFTLPGLTLDALLTPRSRWMVHVRDAAADAPGNAPAHAAAAAATAPSTLRRPLDYAFAATEVVVALFDLTGRRRIDATGLGELWPHCDIVACPRFDETEQWRKFSVGAGLKNTGGDPSVRCILAPVVLLDFLEPDPSPPGATQAGGAATSQAAAAAAARPTVIFRDDGGVLELAASGWSVKIDAATGRLLELSGPYDGAALHVSIRPGGEAAGRIDALLRRTPQVIHLEKPADLEPAIRTVTAMLGALSDLPEWREPLQPFARLEPAAAPLALMLRPLVQAVIEEAGAFNARGSGGGDNLKFYCGPPPPNTPDAMTCLFASGAALAADATAPRGHWAWTMIRESMLLRGGEFRSAGREIQRLQREKRVGPVAAMAIARSPLGGPRPAAMFARDALAMPEPQALVGDLRFLVEGQTALSRAIRESAEVLKTMSDADIQAIARALPPAVAQRFVRIANQLRQRKDEPMENVLIDAIGQLWTPALRDQLIADLSKIADGKRP